MYSEKNEKNQQNKENKKYKGFSEKMFISDNQENQRNEINCETKCNEKLYINHLESNEKKNEINEQNKNDQHIKNCAPNKNEHNTLETVKEFKDPRVLFDFVFSGKNTDSELKAILINEIKSIINIMNQILYTPPYPILFGRISIAKPKEKFKSKQIAIDQSFYDGFGIE